MFFGRMYGSEKALGERDWRRRIGYKLLGELHIPGRLRIWHLIKEFRRLGLWSPRPLRLLDAGGGEGGFAYYLARRFPTWSVVVGDNEPDTLERGRRIKSALQLDNLEVRHLDLLTLQEEDAYDVIVCSDVLEHIEADDEVVRRLSRALRPGGVLIVTSPGVPQPRHLKLVEWREKRIGFKPSDYGHVRQGYSHESLKGILEQAGLAAETIRWTFGRFGTLMFDIFFVTGDSRPHPAVFAGLFPFYMTLSALDVALPIRHGAAILGVGRRP